MDTMVPVLCDGCGGLAYAFTMVDALDDAVAIYCSPLCRAEHLAT